MLARLRSFDRTGHMQMVGKRIVDRVDVGIGQKVFVRAVSLRNSQRSGGFLRLGLIPRSDGDDAGPLSPLHGRDDFLEPDSRSTENSPANLVRHSRHDIGYGSNLKG